VSATRRITMIYQTLAKLFLICSGGAEKFILSLRRTLWHENAQIVRRRGPRKNVR
jgi:hypothetical protein